MSDLLTLAEAAAILKCRPSTLYARVAQRKFPAIRLWEGGRKPSLRFTRELIEEHLRKSTVQPKPSKAA